MEIKVMKNVVKMCIVEIGAVALACAFLDVIGAMF